MFMPKLSERLKRKAEESIEAVDDPLQMEDEVTILLDENRK